jgi:chemotaxis protein MotB
LPGSREHCGKWRNHLCRCLDAAVLPGGSGVLCRLRMPKLAWTIAGVLTTVLLIALAGFSSCEKSREVDRLGAELAAAQEKAEKDAASLGRLREQFSESQAKLQQLEREKHEAEAAVQTHQSLEDEMRAALQSRDVTISQLQGKLTVNILDRVLFDSGAAELKPDGELILRKVADVLRQHASLKVHVIGHTDNVPIRSGTRSRFASNWELSTARAAAAVRFLSETAGVDPRRLGIVGYGEFRPLADNSTAEGRARNRRIAITILPDELAGSDVVPAVSPPATNAPALLPAVPPQPTPPSGPPED